MRQWKIIASALFLLLLLSIPAYSKSGGGTAANFLLIDPGASSFAMGGAQVAVPDGLDALYWNPAALGSFKRNAVGVSYLRYFESAYLGNVSAGFLTHSLGNFGFRFSLLDSGAIPKTDIVGVEKGDFFIRDMAVGPNWGIKIADIFSLGAGLKYISQTVEDISVAGFASDAGAILSVFEEKLNFGFALQNFGGQIKDRPLPSLALFGLSFRPIPKLTFSGQGDYGLNSPMIGRIGAEYKFMNAFPVRVGYKIEKDSLSSLSFGGGAVIRNNFLLDYAFGLARDVSDTHRISLTFQFGGEEREDVRETRRVGIEKPAKVKKGKLPEGLLVRDYEPPQTIAVLPFRNNTNDLEAPLVARDLVRVNLLRKGYSLMEESKVDALLKKNFGITDGGQLNAATHQQIGETLSADGLIYGEVEQFKLVPAGAYNERTAEMKLTLVRATDGTKLFENQKKASDKSVELTTEGMLKAGLTAAGEKAFAKILGHPLRPITAAAVNKSLRNLPPTPTGMKDFGGRTRDEVGIDERCVALTTVHPFFGAWAGTEIDVFADFPLCYKPTGIPNFDSFFDKVNLFIADIYLASTILHMKNSGRLRASNGKPISLAVDNIIPIVSDAIKQATGIIDEGQKLITSAPSQFTGVNALKLPQIVKALKLSIQNLTTTLKEGKAILSGLKGEPVPSENE